MKQKELTEPIRSIKSINAVKSYFKKRNMRNYVIFCLGINSGLRVSDLLSLNVGDVKNKEFVLIYEKKTRKRKKFPINSKLQKIINKFTAWKKDEEPLFVSKKGSRISQSQVYRILNCACKYVGIKENIGTHTMRKTFGYHHYRQFKDVAMLQKIFNHASPYVTLRYIGIDQDEIDESYSQFNI